MSESRADDMLDQIIDAMAKALHVQEWTVASTLSAPAWDDETEDSRNYWRDSARAALRAGMEYQATGPCATCEGVGYGAEQYASRGIGFAYPACETCDGSGRVPLDARLMLGEQVRTVCAGCFRTQEHSNDCPLWADNSKTLVRIPLYRVVWPVEENQ